MRRGMTGRRSGRERQKGVTLIVTTALMAAALPVMGLAIDASFLYTIKAKLSAAVDAAALAGARSLNRGVDLASQRANAEAVARNFFNANFPSGHLGTRSSTLSLEVDETVYKTRTVAITATAIAPSYFLRFMGIGDTTVRAGGKASRRDVNLVLVLDRSGSMSANMPAMRAAAIDFVEQRAEGRDNVGLIVYSNGYKLAFPPNGAPNGPDSNFKSSVPNVTTLIGQTGSQGGTETAGALWEAYQMLVRRNEPGSLNLIVFFTDGVPNGVTGDYNADGASLIKGLSGCQYKSQPGRPMIGFVARGAGICKLDVGTMADSPYRAITTNSLNCAYASDTSRYGNDVNRLPATDLYGNATNGVNRYVVADLSRPTDSTQIAHASLNAADDAVRRIHADANLKPIVYVIGLLGGTDQPDPVWMKRISNDPRSIYYSSSIPAGLYAEARNPTELQAAFAKVGSEILRLCQ